MNPGETPERELTEFAGRVADDADIDWSAVDSEGPVHDLIPAFRLIAGISASHRTAAPAARRASIAFYWGPFQVMEKLGEGAFGEVFRAHDPRLQRDVALKLRHREIADETTSAREFLEEARRLARVRHPNVVVIHGADIHDGRFGLWTDYVAGPDLDVRLGAGGVLLPSETTDLGVALASALGAIHDAGLVHGDVKPSNVLLGDDGPRLTDFGAGSDTGSEQSPRYASPRFAAPELFDGAPASTASDQYALGVLLYRCCTGTTPVDAASFEEAHRAHARGAVTALASLVTAADDLPLALVRVIDRTLAPNPRRRYETLAAFGAALAEARTPPRNVPGFATTFIGRAADMTRLAEVLATSRLATVTGAGGVGKTRLAAEYGRTAAFADGVYWIDLAPLTSADVASGVRQGLGCDPDIEDDEVAIASFAAERRALLVLDNGEHVLDALRPIIARLLVAGARIHILITSREPLRRSDEVVVALSPLDVSDTATSPAVQLFVDRARHVAPMLELSPRSTAAIRSICAQLDGVPLALELAAARMRSFDVVTLERRILGHGLADRILADPNRTGRHASMHAVIEWSLDLATEAERDLLARLTVFGGSWDIDSVEAVCAGQAVDVPAVLEAHAGLVDKSLVAVDERSGGSRYHLLQLVREVGAARLDEEVELSLRRRHREHLRSRLKGFLGPLLTGDPSEALAFFRLERDSLLGLIAWFGDRRLDLERTGALVNAAYRYWERESQVREAVRACRRVLGDDPVTRFRSYDWATFLTVVFVSHSKVGRLDEARTATETALAIFTELGEDDGAAAQLANLTHLALEEGDLDAAEAYAERALDAADAIGDPRRRCFSHLNAGAVADRRRDFDRAAHHHAEALRHCREIGDLALLSWLLVSQGRTLHAAGHVDEAVIAFEQAIEEAERGQEPLTLATALVDHARTAGSSSDWTPVFDRLRRASAIADDTDDDDLRGFVLQSRALCELRSGDHIAALRSTREALGHMRDTGTPRSMWPVFETLASLALARGDHDTAAWCVGVAGELADTLDFGGRRAPAETARLAEVVHQARAALGSGPFAERVEAGKRCSWVDAAAIAIRTTAGWLD